MVTTSSTKSAKKSNVIIHFPPARPSQGSHRLVLLPRDEEKDVCGASDEEKE